jgi:hypothetical protein
MRNLALIPPPPLGMEKAAASGLFCCSGLEGNRAAKSPSRT